MKGKLLVQNIIWPTSTRTAICDNTNLKLSWKMGSKKTPVPDGPPPKEQPFEQDGHDIAALPVLPPCPESNNKLAISRPTAMDFDPLAPEDVVEPSTMNDKLSGETLLDIDGLQPTLILDHTLAGRMLRFKVQFLDGNTEYFSLADMQTDYLSTTAKYILDRKVGHRAHGKRLVVQAWAQKTMRDLEQCVRRLWQVYKFGVNNNNSIY